MFLRALRSRNSWRRVWGSGTPASHPERLGVRILTFIKQPVLTLLRNQYWLQGELLPVPGRRNRGYVLDHAHSPMVLTFSLPHGYPAKLCWKMPKSWTTFEHDEADHHRAYAQGRSNLQQMTQQCQSEADVAACFLQWARDVEQAVSTAVHCMHVSDPAKQPCPCLPSSAKGRCEERHRKWLRVPQAARRARDGDYSPPAEAISIKSKMMIRQVRRIQTYIRGRRKLLITPGSQLESQLRQEWAAVVRAKGFPPRFDAWLLRVGYFTVFWYDRPPLDWLEDVLQYTRHTCDATVRQAAKNRAKYAEYRMQWDAKYKGSRQAFAAIRAAPFPPFSTIPVKEERECALHVVCSQSAAWYQMDFPQFLRHFSPCATGIGGVHIVHHKVDEDVGPLALLKRYQRSSTAWPDVLLVSQHTLACSPE